MRYLLIIILISVGNAFAQAVPADVPRVVFPTTTVGNTINLGPLTADASNAARFSFGAAANGSIFANSYTRLPTAGGASVDVAVAGKVSNAAAAAAIGKFATRVVAPLQVGLAVYDLAKELGFTLGRTSAGDMSVTADQTSTCVVTQTTIANAQSSCKGNGFVSGTPVTAPVNSSYCSLAYKCLKTDGSYYNISAGSVPLQTSATPSPSSMQALQDAIAAKSGWPSTSAIGRALADAVAAGQAAKVEPTAVTGPASQPLTSTTTTNPSQNTSTVTNVTQNYSYGPSSVTVTNVTTGAVTNTSTGAVSPLPTTTESLNQPATPQQVTCGMPGAPPCRIDESGTPQEVTVDKYAPKADAPYNDAKASIDSAASISTPAWNFSFAFPTGCAPYVTGLRGVILNVCAYQSTIHDLLSMVWAAATAFCIIGMVGRTIREA